VVDSFLSDLYLEELRFIVSDSKIKFEFQKFEFVLNGIQEEFKEKE
jgi:hypothetical protein